MREKSFCNGYLCHAKYRINNCASCGITLCKLCTSLTDSGQIFCPDCYLDDFIEQKTKQWSPDWDRLNTEFEEMLKTIKVTKCKDAVRVTPLKHGKESIV